MRRPAARVKPRIARKESFLSPIGGWVKNENIARPAPGSPQGAERLVNIFPTATSAELRGGSIVNASLGDKTEDVRSFMRYKNGSEEKLFAAIDSGIFDITTATDPDISPDPVVSDTTSGDWSSVQFATTGGVFLVAVNGSDAMRLYDGQFWYPITSSNLYQLAYDNETANFTAGATLTGGTSGATATIVAVQDNGSNGILILSNLSHGPFQNNEALTDSLGGAGQANGTEFQIFNGVTFEDGAGPVPSMTTADLSYVWSYKYRLFFIEPESMNVWYAALDQVGGVLKAFPMGGIFPLGGSLLFGASWSLDSGADGGLSAQCIMVTTEGEVAVFQGMDPSVANDWSLVGVYRIGKPLGPDAWHRAGGDIVINTDIGHVPLSQAINRDLAALSPASVSYPIETAWNEYVAQRRFADWHCVVWPERQMILIALPTGDGQQPVMLVANARTGRWAEFTGWNGKCLVTFQGRLLFGSTEGKVIEAYVTGLDQGAPYTALYVPLFDDFGDPTAIKVPTQARAVLRSNSPINDDVSMQYDFNIALPPPPAAQIMTAGSVWGLGKWGPGGSKWGAGLVKTVQQIWRSVGGFGFAMAPALQFTSGSIAPLAAEIIRIDVLYDEGDV